jgi:hypothetical protein
MELISQAAYELDSIFAQFDTNDEASIFAEAVMLVLTDAIMGTYKPDEEPTIINDCFDVMDYIYNSCHKSMLEEIGQLGNAIRYANFDEQCIWARNLQTNILVADLMRILQQED